VKRTFSRFGLGLILALSVPSAVAAAEYPLQVSPDGRRVLDASGHAVFFHGESPWHLFARLTREETISYLDDRQSRGFNALLVSLFVSDGYSTGSTENAYGEQPFLAPGDFTRPNEAYFSHVDWAMQEAQTRGFTLFVVPVYLGYNCGSQGWCAEVLSASLSVLRDFGEWIGTRYRDRPNIVWMHGGDTDAANFGAMDDLQAIVDGILATDPNHLNSAHCDRNFSAADCYGLPWLQFNATYSDCTQTPRKLRDDWVRQPIRPFVYIEGIYEGEFNFTQRCLRSQAYWSLLGGAVGQFYGSGAIWDFPGTWENGMDSPGVRAMLHFRKLQISRAWRQFEPDYGHETLVAGYGDLDSGGYAAAARASGGQSVVAYLPSPRTVTIAMDRISGAGAVAWWFDPVTGAANEIGRFPTSGTREFTSPSNQDWVLVIDDESLDLDPPGQVEIGVSLETGSLGGLKSMYGSEAGIRSPDAPRR
jgi:hypothetical protein